MVQKSIIKPDTAFLSRKSIFAFSEKAVEEEKLSVIFEAARWAPSSYNAQPWRYLYAGKGQSGYKELNDLLLEGNKVWASTAPVLILSFTEAFDKKKQRNNFYAFHDLGLSTANLLIQAASLGLCTHPMGGFDRQKAKLLPGVTEGFEPGTMIALGYEGDPSILSEELLKRHEAVRTRKPIGEIVFHGKWETQ